MRYRLGYAATALNAVIGMNGIIGVMVVIAISMLTNPDMSRAETAAVVVSTPSPAVLGPVTVKVPDTIINKGFILESEDKQWELNQSTITVQPKLESTYVSLTDDDGRLRDFEYVDLGADLFTRIYPREWRVSIYAGNTIINGTAARGLLQNGSLDEENFDLDWQPGAFGLRVGIATQDSGERHFQIDSQYDVIALRTAATYERAHFLGLLHAMIYGGVFVANHHIELFDNVVSRSGTTNTFGPFGGLDLLYPIVNNVWLTLRGSMSYQRVEFKSLNFAHNFVERSIFIGASYGF